MNPFTLVLGTRNKKKRKELQYLLKNYENIQLQTLDEYPTSIDVEETGSTFAENAALKATEQALAIGQWVMGEDSGLSVAALDGAPGIYSARFAGQPTDDEANNDLLLEKLKGVPTEKRTAWYTCNMALSNPDGEIVFQCEGRCYGLIREARHGDGGFGYDPMFEIPEYSLTFGQLGDAVKSLLSHRARAMRMFVPQLLRIAAEQSKLAESQS